MDTKTQLFIRACKVEDAPKRLDSLYSRYYLVPRECFNEVPKDYVICSELLNIISKFLPRVETIDILEKSQPYHLLYLNMDYWYRVKKTLINYIRFISVSELPGYIVPAKYRNR